MKEKEKIFNQIQTLLNCQHFGVLATQGLEYPYCTLVGYAVSGDGKEILFATIRDTRKYKNLKIEPKVSLLIDSQTNKKNDFKDAQALTVLGAAKEVEIGAYEVYLGLYLKKHPYLKEFVSSSNCALIKVNVSKYILVNNFKNVFEYSIN